MLGSLKSFVRGDGERTARAVALRYDWKNTRAPEEAIKLTLVDPAGTDHIPTYDQSAVADAWLYGDLVHAFGASEMRSGGDYPDLDEDDDEFGGTGGAGGRA